MLNVMPYRSAVADAFPEIPFGPDWIKGVLSPPNLSMIRLSDCYTKSRLNVKVARSFGRRESTEDNF
jgi:hypothetical protein